MNHIGYHVPSSFLISIEKDVRKRKIDVTIFALKKIKLSHDDNTMTSRVILILYFYSQMTRTKRKAGTSVAALARCYETRRQQQEEDGQKQNKREF